ncbi:MAG: glycosyltransferase [Desulfovibrionaceae bacterium]|nr:glycosyltransferase [Desulfovibrionaceae bacterium]
MTPLEVVHRYSREVMCFCRPEQAPQGPGRDPEKEAERCLRLLEKSGRQDLVLFGLGSGRLAGALDQRLPQGTRVLVCDLTPGRVRSLFEAGGLDWWRPEGRIQVLADTSPWAHLCLAALLGMDAEHACLTLNSELQDTDKTRLRALQKVFARAEALDIPCPDAEPDIGAAAVLAPTEPGLERFFAQFPDWVRELVVVWDAPDLDAVPEALKSARPGIKNLAQPLNEDFAAQRNRMLAACSRDWVLYLDADEVLGEDAWRALPRLTAAPGVAGWYFPRQTFFPDEQHCRIGLGLWPDLQLRLLRRPGARFENPVHERLRGVSGKVGLALDLPILHLSHLRKGPCELRQKLALFDRASKGRVSHALSTDYPHLERRALDLVAAAGENPPRLVLLPENPD